MLLRVSCERVDWAYLLPAFFTPRLGLGPCAQMSDVLEHTSHRSAEEQIIFLLYMSKLCRTDSRRITDVVHGHDLNYQLEYRCLSQWALTMNSSVCLGGS